MKFPEQLELSVGPIPYCWDRATILRFYQQVTTWPVDCVYLGEVVCSKRHTLSWEDWQTVSNSLQEAGKQVIFSGLTLPRAPSEQANLTRWCEQSPLQIEANDVSSVAAAQAAGKSFVGGPGLNIYNCRTLNLLIREGMTRWVPPYELPRDALSELMAGAPESCQCELFAWGQMPLSWSSRCYTARSMGNPKDNCMHACREFPRGQTLFTTEGAALLTINGVQVLSAATHNLAPWIRDISSRNVSCLRLVPQIDGMATVVEYFDRLRRNPDDKEALRDIEGLAEHGTCDGYWTGEAGLSKSAIELNRDDLLSNGR